MEFGKPDAAKKDDVQVQNEPKLPENNAKDNALVNPVSDEHYDMLGYVADKRESASTGARQKLEANDFNDEAILESEGYTRDENSENFIFEEEDENEDEGEGVELSEEWLDIFAWAGVELTDEVLPRILEYLHAEDSPERFKLEPSRRDKLKIAWLAFLRRVLPNWSDQQGLIAVIIMLYIENLVVGVWKTFMRIMSGTFTLPNVFPFNRFGNTNRQQQQEEVIDEPTIDDFYSDGYNEDLNEVFTKNGQPTVVSDVVEPNEQQKKMLKEVAQKKSEKKTSAIVDVESEVSEVTAPAPQDLGNGKGQDAIDQVPYTISRGYPKKEWVKTHPTTGVVYRIAKGNFRTQKTMQKWLWSSGFYSNRNSKRGRPKKNG